MFGSVIIFLIFVLFAPVLTHAQDTSMDSTQLIGWQDPNSPDDGYRRMGLGFGAAAVYKKEKGVAGMGYVEMVYEDYAKETKIGTPSNLDQQLGVARGVVNLGYRLNERWVFNSELRWDRDLRDSRTGQFSADLAYVDYAFAKDHSLRGGIILVPMGMINEFHQPQEFVGTHRDFGEVDVIPTNWHALGFGLAGRHAFLDYRVFIVNGFNAAGYKVDGGRDTREISTDTISHPAVVFRIDDHPFKGGIVGGSYYVGNAGLYDAPAPTDLKIHTVLMEVHGEIRRNGWLLRAQYSKALLDPSLELNIALGIQPGEPAISKREVGGYVEGGYNFLKHRNNGTTLMPYARYEARNPQDAVPNSLLAYGFLNEHEHDQIVKTVGVQYGPIERLLIKVDFQHVHSELIDVGVNHFNIGLSYLFF